MYFIVTLLMVVATLVLHEAGHAFEMRRNNIAIEEVGIGCRFGPSKLFHPTFLPYPLRVWCIPLLAYVMPEQSEAKKFEAMAYLPKARIMGVGVLLNLLAGALLVGTANIYLALASHDPARSVTQGVTWYFAAWIIWIGRISIVSYVLPFLTVALIALIAIEIVGGINLEFGFSWGSHSVAKAAFNAGLISIRLALFNLLPYGGFDGEQLFDNAVTTIFGKHVARKAHAYILGVVVGSIVLSLVVALL